MINNFTYPRIFPAQAFLLLSLTSRHEQSKSQSPQIIERLNRGF